MTSVTHYRLTRPDGLGLFHRRSAAQFGVAALGIGFAMLALVLHAAGAPARVALALGGVVLVVLGGGRTPAGEDLLDLAAPAARSSGRRVAGRHRHVTVLSPAPGGQQPPLFSGLTIADATLPGELGTLRRCGVVVDRGDGTVSLVLRVHGEGFLLSDTGEQDARLACFGSALAGVGREESALVRASWSQFTAPRPVGAHLDYLEASARADADEQMRSAYLELLEETSSATAAEVLVTLSASLARVRPAPGQDRLAAAIARLVEETVLFSGELARGGLATSGPLPAGAIARSLRERLDPGTRDPFGRRARSILDVVTLVSPENAFPLAIEERRRAISCDESWHRVFRVAEWPRTPVRADWLAAFLCEREVTRSFSVSFTPIPRQLARRQARSVATRVGAGIEEREQKGRRVGAEERRAQLAAEALDEELESGAQMELVLGLVDVSAADEQRLELACERTIQSAADAGMELRVVELRQGEALLGSLPLGRAVLGRAR